MSNYAYSVSQSYEKFQVVKSIPITDIVHHYLPGVEAKKQGRRLSMLCPFHSDKNPSLSIFTDSNTWRCWACGEHGDNTDLAAKLFNISSLDAARLILRDFGLEVDKPLTAQARREIQKQKEKRELHKWFNRYCDERYSQLCMFYQQVQSKLATGEYPHLEEIEKIFEKWLDVLQFKSNEEKASLLLGGYHGSNTID